MIPESMMWVQILLNCVICLSGGTLALYYGPKIPFPAVERVALTGLVLALCASKGYVAYELVVQPGYDGPQEMVGYLFINVGMAFFGMMGCLALAATRLPVYLDRMGR